MIGPSLLDFSTLAFRAKPELTIVSLCFIFCRALCDEGFRAELNVPKFPDHNTSLTIP